ncbi:MAG: AAA family ATPase [Acidimicrobiales bacterium]
MRNPKILVLDRGHDLAVQVKGAAGTLRPAPEVVACERLGAAAEVLEEQGPFDVIVAGPSLASRTGLTRLAVINDDLPLTTVVLAFDHRPDAALRDVVRTGAVDLLQLPARDDALAATLDRAITLSQSTLHAAERRVRPAVATPPLTEPSHRGRVFTISSATGGCGKTFYATNLGYFLTRYTGKRACVVDLDLQFGEVVTAMRLRPRFTVFDALQRDDGDNDDLRAHIEEYTVQHETGVHVLAAPRDPSEADRISPPDVTKIVEAVRARFDYVIVDTPPQLNEQVLAAFDLSDVLYVMATLDLPSVRNMSVFLGTLERLKISADNVRLILNKAESDVGIEVEQVTRLFPQGFESILPYAKEVSRSINLGMPVLASSPQAEISRLMTSGLRNLLPLDQQSKVQDVTEQRRHGLFRRRARSTS